ncbi:hypothetical protein GQ55_2G137200 [Panicum hallii var. hallii]|uniref:Uncharacterized protein n=1 Tax=Panicum hallii var. hallii TaxID=1504633 RepID=A0A2T7EPK7_9POAL|nr:hypothetical protein GQ55_2G137200 [Panicum hallii var. hallii]
MHNQHLYRNLGIWLSVAGTKTAEIWFTWLHFVNNRLSGIGSRVRCLVGLLEPT